MPIPISISSSPSSNVGFPAAGTVHEVRAIPIDRALSFTFRQTSTTSFSGRRCSAAAPAIFSINTVAPTPRRPAVYSESWTATSSSTSTDSTSVPSERQSSAAISKFMTSPV